MRAGGFARGGRGGFKKQRPGPRPKAAIPTPAVRATGVGQAANWFIVLWTPPAFSAASPAKYSLWSSPMSDPDMFWCFTQAMP